jgi:MoaA/NifB/PqqE/SkfB family radical SAM enzyme
MKALSRKQYLAIPARVLWNRICGKPSVVSFEVTLSCIANCKHCDTGGYRKNEQRLALEDYGKYIQEFKPAIVQLSGGEPFLRDDLPDIMRVVKNGGSMPYVIVVSNGYLLTEQKYMEMKEAGADRFSLSLDFPDERHDEFRRIPGLYKHLSELMPKLASHGNGDLAMNCCITKANMSSLAESAIRCQEWGVDISYSAYSARRTGNVDLTISSAEDLDALENSIHNLIDMREAGVGIMNPPSILLDIHKFFKEGGTPNCSAGQTFFVVRPEGVMNPCSMHRNRRYESRKEMVEDFTNHNECKDCYVAIRAYSDKSIGSLFKDAIELIR